MKRPDAELRLKPTERLRAIMLRPTRFRQAHAILGPNANVVEVGNYLRAMTGCVKELPKVMIWQMYMTLSEKFQELQEAHDQLKIQYEMIHSDNARLRAAHPETVHAAPSRGSSAASIAMDAIEDNLFHFSGGGVPSRPRLPEPVRGGSSAAPTDVDAMEVDMPDPVNTARPARVPKTPQRVRPDQSYPTPPNTISPASRERPSGVLASGDIDGGFEAVDGTGQDDGIGCMPLRIGRMASRAPAIDRSHSGRIDSGDELDVIIRTAKELRAKTNRERLELQRQLHEAQEDIAFCRERDQRNLQRIADLERGLAASNSLCAQTEGALRAREDELSAAHRQSAVLAGERDLYQRKHFVTAVALKGSQMQVEKRDEEAKSLLGGIANMVESLLYLQVPRFATHSGARSVQIGVSR
ncbi:hypothetical protein BD414DRAFT_505920 [Trametes punicea]|nr:hypothetical protein BD414DRAFT_505920 [Trametes punicea]